MLTKRSNKLNEARATDMGAPLAHPIDCGRHRGALVIALLADCSFGPFVGI